MWLSFHLTEALQTYIINYVNNSWFISICTLSLVITIITIIFPVVRICITGLVPTIIIMP